MSDIADWLPSSVGIGLIFGSVAGFAAVALAAIFVRRFFIRVTQPEAVTRVELEERRRMLLFCSDAKALADLAVQRHMSNTLFLRHLRSQPCYEALLPYFGESFTNDLLLATENGEEKSKLAQACRDEIERLQHQFLPPSANKR